MEVLSRKIYADTGNSIPKLYMRQNSFASLRAGQNHFFGKSLQSFLTRSGLAGIHRRQWGVTPKA